MNADIVVGLVGGTGVNQIPSQTLATVTETEFQVNTSTSGTTNIAVLTIPSPTAILGSSSPVNPSANAAIIGNGYGSWFGPANGTGAPWYSAVAFDGHPFRVTLSGVVTPASNAANTFQLIIYNGTSKSGTALASTGALTGLETSTTPATFLMQADLTWSSVSGVLQGQYSYNVTGTGGYNTWKTLSSNATSVTLATLQFCASAKWGNAVGGVVQVNEFSISAL